MKKYLIVALVCALFLLSSCNYSVQKRVFKWEIIQSPITGRYYEVVSFMVGATNGLFSISEITQSEYDKYFRDK